MNARPKNGSHSSESKRMNDDIHWNEYFDLPNPDLQAHFMRTRSGNSDIYATPFYGVNKASDPVAAMLDVMNQWQKVLEDSSVPSEWPSLMEFENDLREKVGPMSVMKPLAQRITDIDHYYDLIKLDQKPISEEAISAVVNEFSEVRGLRIRSQKLVVEKMKKSTSSGNPFYQKRREVVDSTCPVELWVKDFSSHIPNYWQKLPKGEWRTCAILGWRGQEGGSDPEDVKQRVIWMFPFGVNICEQQWYQPYIEACQRFKLVPAWVSMDEVDLSITKMFDTKNPKDVVICTDFSKFDQHFNASMQKAAYRIMYQLAQTADESTQDWFTDVYDQKFCIPLAWDEGHIRTGYHGMASGSGGTNCDETMAHRALQHEVAQMNGAKLNPYSQCLGDDGVLTYPGITVDDVMLAYTQHGQEMNPDKQYVSTQDCVYLRRWHHKDYRENGVCVGVYSTYRALNRLAMQERFYDARKWNSKMVCLRYLSILENCKFHPLREKFADFCIKGDKYRLGIDIPGFLDNIEKEAEKAIDEMPDFLGYTKTMQSGDATGISDWWIVKYLKSKA